jgi:hypothetical protein
VPNAKGQCPTCGVFTQGNAAARKHIANVARREQLHAENLAEYQPTTLQGRRACRWLANIDERLETTREGTPEHQRLIAMWTELTATLEASRSSRETHESTNLESLTNDQLIEKATAILRRLLDLRDATRPLPGSREPDTTALDGSPFDERDPAGANPRPDSGSLGATPEPTCPYCHRRCVGRDHVAYDVMHWDDPEQVEKRNPKPTYSLKELYESNEGLIRPDAPFTTRRETETEDPMAEMLESLRRARRGGDPNVR